MGNLSDSGNRCKLLDRERSFQKLSEEVNLAGFYNNVSAVDSRLKFIEN